MGLPPSDSSKKSRHAESPMNTGETRAEVVDLSSRRKARQSGDITILNRPSPGRTPGDDAPSTPDAA